MRESPAFVEIVRVRDGCPLFQGLSDRELRAVGDAGRVQTLVAGDYLFKQGDPIRLLFLLSSGAVVFYAVASDGRRSLLDAVGPGGIVGSHGLAGERHLFTAQALVAGSALAWDIHVVFRLLEASPRLAINSLRLATTRISELTEMYGELVTQPVERRLASTLLRLSEKIGDRTHLPLSIRGLSEEELAAMAGATLFTVNRILRRWARYGVVRTGRRLVAILHPSQLAQLAGKEVPGSIAPFRGNRGASR